MQKKPEQPIDPGFRYDVEILRYLDLHASFPAPASDYDMAMNISRDQFLGDEQKVEALRNLCHKGHMAVFETLGPPLFPDIEMHNSADTTTERHQSKFAKAIMNIGNILGPKFGRFIYPNYYKNYDE